LAGASPDSLSRARQVRRTRFETAIVIDAHGPYVAVEALDRHGQVLARSRAVKLADHD
jgi:hypothetical protein